jgi:hypothetical protein
MSNFKNQFDSFVREFGGEIVDELLPEIPDLPKNADYLFSNRTIIGELKCLEEDYFGATHVGAKIKALLDKWVREGLVSAERFREGRISTRDLPEVCGLQIIGVLTKAMTEAVADANRQIKATRAYFRVPNARGLLVLANVGNFTLTPNLVLPALGRLFRNGYSAIESYIFLVPDIDVTVPGVNKPSRIWASGPTRGPRSGVPSTFFDGITSAWLVFLQKQTPEEIEIIKGQNERTLRESGYVRRKAP